MQLVVSLSSSSTVGRRKSHCLTSASLIFFMKSENVFLVGGFSLSTTLLMMIPLVGGFMVVFSSFLLIFYMELH